jgi:hypothetical protein
VGRTVPKPALAARLPVDRRLMARTIAVVREDLRCLRGRDGAVMADRVNLGRRLAPVVRLPVDRAMIVVREDQRCLLARHKIKVTSARLPADRTSLARKMVLTRTARRCLGALRVSNLRQHTSTIMAGTANNLR